VSARMGRPPLGDRAKGIVFTIRMSADERDEIVAAAERDGKPVTQWARETLLASAASPWIVRRQPPSA